MNQNTLWMPNFLAFIICTVFLTVSGCSTYNTQKTEALDSSKKWIMLPLSNHADAPDAGKRASDIVKTLLRIKGLPNLSTYIAPNENTLELNQQKTIQNAINKAASQGFRYGVSGSIQEWRYKSGLDAEPVAGITLTVIDLDTKQIIWSASGAKTGWGRDSVSGVAHKLIANLIDELSLID
jgi:hypothetical protein